MQQYEYYNGIDYCDHMVNIVQLSESDEKGKEMQFAIATNFAIQLISHLIMQLLEHYEKTKEVFETIKALGYSIKEALRSGVLNAKNLRDITQPFQIRKEISY